MDIKDIIKEATKGIDSLDGISDILNHSPEIMMNQFSESEKQEVNKLVGVFDKTDLGSIENLMKDLKNKQDGGRG